MIDQDYKTSGAVSTYAGLCYYTTLITQQHIR